jgi:hypothetical protein
MRPAESMPNRRAISVRDLREPFESPDRKPMPATSGKTVGAKRNSTPVMALRIDGNGGPGTPKSRGSAPRCLLCTVFAARRRSRGRTPPPPDSASAEVRDYTAAVYTVDTAEVQTNVPHLPTTAITGMETSSC